MTKHLLTAFCAASALLFAAAPALLAQKNVAQVEYRVLPPDFENLPRLENAKWNFGFRPYSSESAAFLWSDPNVIRDVTSGGAMGEKQMPTGLYVACDSEGLTILVFGAHRPSDANLQAGKGVEAISLECFLIPGDADNPKIINYQPFGISSVYPYYSWKLSWMKEDRNNRALFNDIRIDAKFVTNGTVVKFTIPWLPLWDHLPVFQEKADNFWRLSLIRWGGAFGGETWGGVVHSQTQCGYLRMPAFTDQQKTAIMKDTLLRLWAQYQKIKTNASVAPGTVCGRKDFYRQSIEPYPHTWMNVNEDFAFVDAWLNPAIAERNAIGAGIAGFEKMSIAEQLAFYRKNAPLLANFQYDIDEAYAAHLKSQLMKR